MLLLIVVRAQGQGTAFTYQGRLEDGGRPANGLYDIQFQMVDKEVQSDFQYSTAPQMRTLGVTNGVFTTVLDFLDLYEGGRTFYLELSVRPAGTTGALEKLAPRQRITPTPYAIRAGGLTGTLPAHQLPGGVVITDGSGTLHRPIQATDSRNVFGGDGRYLTGVKVPAVGLRNEVRVQERLYRRVSNMDPGDLENAPAMGVLAGDFNGDGRMDLIASRARHGLATLHTNAGGGRLVRAADLGWETFGPKQAVKGTFNGDNSLDVACWREWDKTISIYTNSSLGNFGSMASISITNVSALTAIDVNQDGLTDLAVAHSVDTGARIRIYLNSGSSMVAAASLPLPSAAADLIAVDTNGDAELELVAACVDANEIRMFVNQGGSFSSHVAIPAVRPRAVANGVISSRSPGFTYVSQAGWLDGKFERFEESLIRSILKTADETFVESPTRYPLGADAGGWVVRLEVRDLNGDSFNDVFAAVLWPHGGFRAVQYDSQFNGGQPSRVLDWDYPSFKDVEVAEFDGNLGLELGTGVDDGVAIWVQESAGLSTGVTAQFEGRVGVLGQFNAMGGATVSGGLEVKGKASFSGAVSAERWSVTGPLTVSGPSALSDVAINGDLQFGTRTRQMLNLYGTDYGIGVQPETLYFRTPTGSGIGFAWFAGGSHFNSPADPGTSGLGLMRLKADGLSVTAGGGALSLGDPLEPDGLARIDFRRSGDDTLGYSARLENDAPGLLSVRGRLGFGTETRQMLNLWGSEYGIGVQSSATYFRSSGDFYWFRGGSHDDANGSAGNNGRALMKLSREGRIGLGNDSPAYPIDVLSAVGVARLVSTNNGFGSVLVLQNSTPLTSPGYYGAINFENATTTAGQIGYMSNDQMTFRVAGHQRMVIDASGNVAITGAFSQASDRNVKQDIEPVDPEAVLRKVADLPIAEWSYRHDQNTRHVGPMAQDFHAAFGLGTDERHIATVDADGVALAAIQGLNRHLNRQLESVRRENAELRERLERIERRMMGGKDQ